MNKDDRSVIDTLLEATRERKNLDFKESFNPDSNQDWCEILKDIIAFANSGGGHILIGLRNSGEPSGNDVSKILSPDHAVIGDKVRKYTGTDFCDVEILEGLKQSQRVAIFSIGDSTVPIVFTAPGTYEKENGRQISAFHKGMVYFRHGAKSEPGTTDDLRTVIDRRLSSIRREWLSNVKKITVAPEGTAINIVRFEPAGGVRGTIPIRITSDPKAKPYGLIDTNLTYPHRQKDAVKRIKDAFQDSLSFSPYDFQAIRKVHSIDSKPNFFFKPTFASPLYSEALIEWIIAELRKDPNFIHHARDQYDLIKLTLANKGNK